MRRGLFEMLENLRWKKLDKSQDFIGDETGRVITHEGELNFMGHVFRCFKTSDGESFFLEEDMRRFVGDTDSNFMLRLRTDGFTPDEINKIIDAIDAICPFCDELQPCKCDHDINMPGDFSLN